MKFQCPRGTRDFYPEAMAIRNWIFDQWRSVSQRNGFVEYDGPIFESLELYTVKSGDEIVSQLFHFEDRGGRKFALRPEMTPTIARMVAAHANALSRPIKWFSMPRLCRAERPQRGRLREFFQWNIDILGEDSPLADAECIFVAADFFREVGLTPENFVIKINSRAMLAELLTAADIETGRHDAVYAVLDKREKLDADTFKKTVLDLNLETAQSDTLLSLGEAKGPEGLERVRGMVGGHEAAEGRFADLEQLFSLLETMGVADCCRFDMGVVRGLAYYTGVVFEAFGKGGLQRAIAGGGRYDNLLKEVGGPPMSAVGFATSDVVIEDLLRECGKLPDDASTLDVFVIDADKARFDDVVRLTTQLRQVGVSATFSYKRQNIGKQLKQASSRHARKVVIVDEKLATDRTVGIKDLASGAQTDVPISALLSDPTRYC